MVRKWPFEHGCSLRDNQFVTLVMRMKGGDGMKYALAAIAAVFTVAVFALAGARLWWADNAVQAQSTPPALQ